jgi:hypothetical protein
VVATAELTVSVTPDQHAVALVVTVGRLWLRGLLAYGNPPGSHIGVWRTSWGGLRGLNVRVGRRIVGPCVTAFVHQQWKD